MTQSELISKINVMANVITKASIRGSGNYITTSKAIYDYINSINSKSSKRKEKIKKILKNE